MGESKTLNTPALQHPALSDSEVGEGIIHIITSANLGPLEASMLLGQLADSYEAKCFHQEGSK